MRLANAWAGWLGCSVLLWHSWWAGEALGVVGDSFVATWKGNAKAAYSLSTDDVRKSQVYVIAPALTERDLHGTFYVNPDLLLFDSLLDIDDVNHDGKLDGYAHLVEQGHEVGSHTTLHWSVVPGYAASGYPNNVFSSYEALRADCDAANDLIFETTGQHVVSFAYPWGFYSPGAEEVLSQKYLSARTLDYSGYNGVQYNPNPATPANMYELRSIRTEGVVNGINLVDYDQASTAFAKMLSDTINQGAWAIEFFHATGTDNNPFSDWDGVNQNAYYEHLNDIAALQSAGTIWQATVGNVTRYIDSRSAAAITYDSITDAGIQLRVADDLDRMLFDVPLTIDTQIPAGWAANLQVTHNGQPISFTTYLQAGILFVSYDVLADGLPINLGASAPSPLPGDYNNDRCVDATDYVIWRSSLATGGVGGDGNLDGTVDLADFEVWWANFGTVASAAKGSGISASSVPEPAGAVYGLIGAFVMGLVIEKRGGRQIRSIIAKSRRGSSHSLGFVPRLFHFSRRITNEPRPRIFATR